MQLLKLKFQRSYICAAVQCVIVVSDLRVQRAVTTDVHARRVVPRRRAGLQALGRSVWDAERENQARVRERAFVQVGNVDYNYKQGLLFDLDV